MRLGLIAAARITDPALVALARELDDVSLTVVGARDLARAEAAADWGASVAQSAPTKK